MENDNLELPTEIWLEILDQIDLTQDLNSVQNLRLINQLFCWYVDKHTDWPVNPHFQLKRSIACWSRYGNDRSQHFLHTKPQEFNSNQEAWDDDDSLYENSADNESSNESDNESLNDFIIPDDVVEIDSNNANINSVQARQILIDAIQNALAADIDVEQVVNYELFERPF